MSNSNAHINAIDNMADDTGQITKDERLQTFTIFPKLAIELQLTIWEFAVEVLDSRVTQLMVKSDGNISSTTLAPTLLHVW